MLILRQDNELHVYFKANNGLYEANNMSYDWMCTINEDKAKFAWNDHFVPTIEDMEFILNIQNNFDEAYQMAEDDYLHTEEFV